MNAKNQIKKRLSENGYSWNPSKCDCECNKKCEIDECLNNFTCAKSVPENLIVTQKDKTIIRDRQLQLILLI